LGWVAEPVLFITYQVNSATPFNTDTPLNLAAQVGQKITQLNGGGLTLNPPPTNAGNDAGVDGTLHVVQPSGELFFANQTVQAGTTFTEPLQLTAGPTSLTITAADTAMLFDPTVLQITNVTNAGGLLGSFSLTDNIDNTNGSLRVGLSSSGSASLGAGASGTVLFVTFQVNGSAAGSTVANLAAQVGQKITQLNGGGIVLNPSPLNTAGNGQATNNPDPTDGLITVNAAPTNQPPIDTLPGAQQVLSGANLVFSTANGNAITVDDIPLPEVDPITAISENTSNVVTVTANNNFMQGRTVQITGVSVAGYNGAFTITAANSTSFTYTDSAASNLASASSGTATSQVKLHETGNEVTTLSVAHGTLKPGGNVPGTVSVSGSGTGTLQLIGPVVDITTALNGLTYASPSTFSGGDTLTVSTNDQGNSGAGGAMSDSRSVQLTDVRLFINEVFVNPPDPNNVTSDPVAQYVEIRSSAPNFTLPSGTYLIGVNGQNPLGSLPNNPSSSLGLVQDVFDMSGKQTGSNGVLVIMETGNSYTTDAAGTKLINTGTAAGFGNGGSSTTVGHTGLTNDLQTGSSSYFLLQASTNAPVAGSTDIDAANNGTINGGATASWNIQDSVGFTDELNTDATNVDRAYAALNFLDANGSGQGINNAISLTGLSGSPNYLARNANSTGSNGTAANPDWLASVAQDNSAATADNNFILGFANPSTGTGNNADTSLAGFGGHALSNVGGLNFFLASIKSMVINDGNAQRSQITGQTVNFTSPVSFNQSDLANIFKVKDGSGNFLTLAFTVTGTLTGGVFTNVTSVRITYAATSVDSYTLGRALVNSAGTALNGGSRQALNDGNYSLLVNGGLMTDVLGQHADAAGSGVAGSTATIEFYRLYGDFNGDRAVDYVDQNQIRQAVAGGANATGTTAQKNLYNKYSFFDYDGNGLIDANDFNNQFVPRRGTVLNP
jgi:hypothetical protein